MSILRWFSGLFGQKRVSKDGPTLSIVLLLREFRDLPQLVLVQAAERAWNADFHTEENKKYVLAGPVASLVQFGGRIFLSILSVPKPYRENPKRESENIPELRQRQAWAEHNAWISLDFNGRILRAQGIWN